MLDPDPSRRPEREGSRRAPAGRVERGRRAATRRDVADDPRRAGHSRRALGALRRRHGVARPLLPDRLAVPPRRPRRDGRAAQPDRRPRARAGRPGPPARERVARARRRLFGLRARLARPLLARPALELPVPRRPRARGRSRRSPLVPVVVLGRARRPCGEAPSQRRPRSAPPPSPAFAPASRSTSTRRPRLAKPSRAHGLSGVRAPRSGSQPLSSRRRRCAVPFARSRGLWGVAVWGAAFLAAALIATGRRRRRVSARPLGVARRRDSRAAAAPHALEWPLRAQCPRMSVLRSIEHRIESLVEGVFGRAFRSHVQPVELARKLAKEMDEHKTVSISRVYVPERVRPLPLPRTTASSSRPTRPRS